jgi:serine protease SohB
MSQALLELVLFASKSIILFLFIFALLVVFFALVAKNRGRQKGQLTIKNLNKKFREESEELLAEIYPKKLFKNYLKDNKAKDKALKNLEDKPNSVYVLDFQGDIKASAVTSLREEITAVLNIAAPKDEIVVRLESAGGMVHAYGLAAAQLMRIREKNINLTITVDKVAASGGYMMACVANKILAAPFSIIGSIGVVVQLPNFHRLLKDKHVDYEQITAGEYKRTVTMFGENTAEGREKLKEEIEIMHDDFKKLITDYRPEIDIDKVATGEHWLGQQALQLKLVDVIKTSDAYLLERVKDATLYEICYQVKKPMMARLGAGASALISRMLLGS